MIRDIIARTFVSGVINGHAMKGDVLASFNTGRGGNSACAYAQLPPNFTPATLANQL
jgi:hypothetical protein